MSNEILLLLLGVLVNVGVILAGLYQFRKDLKLRTIEVETEARNEKANTELANQQRVTQEIANYESMFNLVSKRDSELLETRSQLAALSDKINRMSHDIEVQSRARERAEALLREATTKLQEKDEIIRRLDERISTLEFERKSYEGTIKEMVYISDSLRRMEQSIGARCPVATLVPHAKAKENADGSS